MAAAKKRTIEILEDAFDLNYRRKFELIVNEKHLADLYFRPVTRADRLEVQGQVGDDDAMKMATYMLIRKAQLENGEKAFSLGDLAKLRRLPEKVLNDLELFMFGVDEKGNPLQDAKND